MSENKKKRIAIVSVLKPVDDTRMFEKFGLTLSAEYEVHILGQQAASLPTEGIHFHAIFNFSRLSLRRLFAGWKVYFKLKSIKPDSVIVTTPELLWVGVVHKVFYRRALYYDIWENYFWNISDGKSFPFLLRSIIASAVRLNEIFYSVFVDKFFLAEKRYTAELSFARPYTILQNKLPKAIADQYNVSNPKGYTKLLFTGTLAEDTGVFDAINLATELHNRDASIRLTIAGYCHLATERQRLLEITKAQEFITLIGGDKLVPHKDILQLAADHDYGIIIYPSTLGTFTSIPTKLFEYLALKLPVLARHNPETHQWIEKYHAGLVLSSAPDYANVLAVIRKGGFHNKISDEIYWEYEAHELILALK